MDFEQEIGTCGPAIRSAGAVFVGSFTPEALGDYWAGPNHVLPTGGAARYASPLGGHSELLFEEPGDVVQFLQSKQYLPLVVFGPKRHPEFPDTPASSEFGHDIDLPNWRGIVASAKVPAPIGAALDAAVQKALDSPEWKKFCAETYTCVDRMDHKQSQAFVEKNFREVQAFMKQFGLVK